MKIAVNTRFLLQGKMEGMGWYIFEIFKRMTQQHPEHEFIFIFDRHYDPAFVFGANVTPVVAFPPARHPLLWYLWYEWSVPYILRKYKADVFVSPDNFTSLSTNLPSLLVVHDIAYFYYPNMIPWVFRKFYQFFTPKYARKADQIVTVSEYVKKDVSKNLSVDLSKITVVHNACKDFFKPLDEAAVQATKGEFTNGADFFLYVGALHPRKNVARLIQAFDRFKSQTGAPLKLALLGRMAWQNSDIEAVYNASAHKVDVLFLGYTSTEDMARLTASAFASTYVSLFEGFGVPPLEAMKCGVPVLASDRTSIPEVCGDAALFVNPESIESIAEGMRKLYDDPALRARLIEKGFEQEQKFDWAQSAAIMWEAIEKTASSKIR